MDPKKLGRQRVSFAVQVKLIIGGREIPGDLVDISLNGALVKLIGNYADEEKCILVVELGTADYSPVLRIPSTIIRQVDAGLAITYDSIDADSYVHLKNLVLYNSADVSDLEEECGKRFGIK